MSTATHLFGNYEAAKKRQMPKWAAPVMAAVVIFHIGVFTTMYVKSIWDLEQLDKVKNVTDVSIAPAPPPPPPPPKGGAKPVEVKLEPKKVTVKDIVQPVKIEKQEPQKVEEVGQDNGVEGGVEGGQEGGVVGGDLSGVVGAPPPPPPPPPPAPPQIVPPTALKQLRIAGEDQIKPSEVTTQEIMRSGKSKIIGSFKYCVTAGGVVSSVNLIKTTGFPAYDQKILQTMRNDWRFKPFEVNGKAVPVCTAVTFIYSQQ